jgi:valyl-tRNA synthetase
MENALRLLHPFMPFVTEDVWAKTGARDNHLMLDAWPTLSDALINKDADAEINWLIEAIGEIRSVRSEMNVPAGAQVPLIIVGANDATKARLGETDAVLKRLARLAEITEADAVPDGAVQAVLGEATLAITLADVIDVDAEKARLKKDIGKVEGEIKKISGKLGNQGFLDKAPQAVIDENKTRLAEEEARRDKLQSALERIS